MAGPGGHELGEQATHRVTHDQRWRVQRIHQRDKVIREIAQAQRCDQSRALFNRQFVIAQGRRVDREAALFECAPGVSQRISAAPGAMDENNMLVHCIRTIRSTALS